MSPDAIIAALDLQPHPEGGFYRETYRAPERIAHDALPARFAGAREYSTAILFLLPGAAFSALHRIAADEVWHFYCGSPLEVVEIAADGRLVITRLGTDLAAGERPQYVVPAGHWFGARLADPQPDNFALVGCTVAPAFDFEDFVIGKGDELAALFPPHEALVREMTRE